MSCIVAIKHGGDIWMGADSVGTGGYSCTTRKDPKIYQVGPFLIGFASSYRMGQILAYSFVPPDHDDSIVDVHRYMASTWIDAVRSVLSMGGYTRKENESEEGGTFIVAYKGRIFKVEDDFQVGESALEFDSCGAGSDIALGSLYTSTGMDDPKFRIERALSAASEFNSAVRGPFFITKQCP